MPITIVSGSPRVTASFSRTQTTLAPGSDVSTSIAGHSRVKSSTMFRVRNRRPVAMQSVIKSIDQRPFGRVGTRCACAWDPYALQVQDNGEVLSPDFQRSNSALKIFERCGVGMVFLLSLIARAWSGLCPASRGRHEQ
jgi:hypothetical protein